MASDMELFAVSMVRGQMVSDLPANDPRSAMATEVAQWIDTELGIDLQSVDLASIRARVPADGPGDKMVYTFEWEGMEWDILDRGLGLEFADPATEMFHNDQRPMDTNDDGTMGPIDALLVINHLNQQPSMLLPSRVEDASGLRMVDVTGNRWVTPLDAMLVINRLNAGDTVDFMTPLIANDDFGDGVFSINATELPAIEIDVLANDVGESIRIDAVSQGISGSVDVVQDASGLSLVRYTPSRQFRNFDLFSYTIIDNLGRTSTATVSVTYQVVPDEVPSFGLAINGPAIGTAAGTEIQFRDESGRGRIQIDHTGAAEDTVGVYLRFAFSEPPYGLSNAGTLRSDVIATDATFYPVFPDGAWITGSIPQVNQILADLSYQPALGYSAPEGVTLNVFAFLYTTLGVTSTYASGTISVVVPAEAGAPVARNDFFELGAVGSSVRLDVLANDSSLSGGRVELVAVGDPNAPSEWVSWPSYGDSSVSVDLESQELIFRPGMLGDYQSFVYVIRDELGRVAQGKVAVSWRRS
ncbi:MAG: Ig-like domain-containing protein [Pirellulaceae bacterium]